MKIDTASKAFIINSLLSAATTSMIIETRLKWDVTKTQFRKIFILTFIVNIVMFYMFTLFIGESFARSMFG